jgi:hypothetical protein
MKEPHPFHKQCGRFLRFAVSTFRAATREHLIVGRGRHGTDDLQRDVVSACAPTRVGNDLPAGRIGYVRVACWQYLFRGVRLRVPLHVRDCAVELGALCLGIDVDEFTVGARNWLNTLAFD